MDEAHLANLSYESLYPFCELLAGAAPTSRLQRLEGVTGTVVPATPERSFMNSVLYDDAAHLEAALPQLAETYDDAGVNAWTVWVRPADAEAARVLEQAGHLLDAQPTAMALRLPGWQPPGERGADIGEIGLAEVARINDVAYGWSDEFVRGFTAAPEEMHLYGARVGGEQVACSAWLRHGDDCAVYLVACLPEARGRGLASGLMVRMLTDAQADGCATTTLQASRAGYSIYRRLGYGDHGPLQMWERRRHQ